MTKMNVPKLRFEGFSEELKKVCYSDVFDDFSYGLNTNGNDYDGENKYLRITDITDDSRKFSEKNLVSPNIDFQDDNNNNYLLRENDIVFSRTGASTGKTYLYDKNDGKVYYAGFLIKGHVKDTFDSKYIFITTLTSMFKKFIDVTSMRSGQPGINSKEYSSYSLNVHPLSEQRKIGLFFAKLDKLIELQNKKIEALKKLKQGYLQKMFPQDGDKIPRFRFKEFSGEWNSNFLSSVVDRLDNKRVPIKESEREIGEVPYYGANGIQGYINGYTHSGENILVAEDGASDISNYPVIYTNGNIWVNNHAHVLKSNIDKSYAKFILYNLKTIKYDKYLTGTGRYKLNADTLMKIGILLPSLTEQEKIGDFIYNIDEVILNEEEKLKLLNKQKKAYLQNLFI